MVPDGHHSLSFMSMGGFLFEGEEETEPRLDGEGFYIAKYEDVINSA